MGIARAVGRDSTWRLGKQRLGGSSPESRQSSCNLVARDGDRVHPKIIWTGSDFDDLLYYTLPLFGKENLILVPIRW